MCGMSTQQWPNTRITVFERTRQSTWLDTETTPVDKKRMNSCVLKHPFFWGSAATKQSAPKPRKYSLRRATNVTFSKFRGWSSKKKRVVWNRASHCFNWSINSEPKILRSCLLQLVFNSVNCNSNLSMCGTFLIKLLPALDNRGLLPTSKETHN